MTQSAKFTLAGHSVALALEWRPVRAGALTIDLTPADVGAVALSMQGTIKGPTGYSGGQCVDFLRDIGGHVPEVAKLCDLWSRWHLSDMRAGTRAQLDALKDAKPDGAGDSHTKALAFLVSRGLHPDVTTAPDFNDGKGYGYGSAWLYEPLPEGLADEARGLFDALNGRKFGEADAPREVEEIAAALGLTVEATFIPYSQSRSAKDPERAKYGPNLNWRVTLCKARPDVAGPSSEAPGGVLEVVLQTDYSAGWSHTPAAKARKGDLIHAGRPEQTARAELVAWECENGKAGRWSTLGIQPQSTRNGGPILPNPADVIASLAMDSGVLDSGGFADWAADFGYDADSIKAKRVFDACMEIALKLKAAIGQEAFAELREAAQNR
jgi:hypothetical protein